MENSTVAASAPEPTPASQPAPKIPKAAKTSGKQQKRVRILARRSVLRQPKTAWIFFCNHHRPDVMAQNPGIKFGDVAKLLAPQWAALSAEERKKFEEMQAADQVRHAEQFKQLDAQQLMSLKLHSKNRKEQKKNMPTAAKSPYMFFVIDQRKSIVLEDPTADFMTIGRILGHRWNQMDPEARKPYEAMHQQDKKRYEVDYAEFQRKTSEINGAQKTQKKRLRSSEVVTPKAQPKSRDGGARKKAKRSKDDAPSKSSKDSTKEPKSKSAPAASKPKAPKPKSTKAKTPKAKSSSSDEPMPATNEMPALVNA